MKASAPSPILAMLGAFASKAFPTGAPTLPWQPFTPKGGRGSVSKKKDGLPRNYPGAKLARKAMMSQVAVKHPRGMRLDGVTV